MHRKETRRIAIGNRFIGGGSPVLVQSMTNKPASEFEGTLHQIRTLAEAGCDIVRVTVPNREAVRCLYRLKENSSIPIVADIHFDYRMAIESVEAGADKIRINPGNLGERENLLAVARACRDKGVPIRVGVNSGSVERDLLVKYNGPKPEALCESALRQVARLEEADFENIVVSVKSSDVPTMIATNRLLAERCTYPLHLGVTEAGTYESGLVKSSVGIGSLLCDGIGDTIRVSLTTNDLTEEIRAARTILSACGLMEKQITFVSCPTCGRTKIDLVKIASEIEERTRALKLTPARNVKVAVMGCVVNGPGEAKEADVGIAGGRSDALLFRHGHVVCKISEDRVIETLLEEIKKVVEETYHEGR
ncbi:MAG: flavodoxin-dependent (E)-4-hydroxy-3-methylbut-2-enyl-diphosphate synthase [Clostridia bacterium]|nr:flavodoxin-dependent (E)-4-hydroxy-3-methylbut-2-enyl-diphosphate synthase [Clostridia bacterium]